MPKADAQPLAKQRLLEAAVEELAEVGWDGARTRSVANRAGLNPGLVHYHFDSMDDLLLQAATRALMDAVASPSSHLMTAPTVGAGLETSVDELVELSFDDPVVRVLIEAMVQAGRRPEVRNLMAESLRGFRVALTERLTETGLAQSRASAQAGILAAAIDGLLLHAYVDPDFDPRPAAHELTRLMGET